MTPSVVVQMTLAPSWGIQIPSSHRQSEAIDLWFWREASFTVWEEIRLAPDEYDSLVGLNWRFEQVEGQTRGRMSISQVSKKNRNNSSWSDLYRWLGEKLSLVYERIIPKLRDAMGRHEAR